MSALEWHTYLNTQYWKNLKSFYSMIFFEAICFELPCIAGAQMTDPQHEALVLNENCLKSPRLIWIEICPCKISILTYFNNCFVKFFHPWFLPFDQWCQLKPQNCPCEKQALFLSKIDLRRCLLVSQYQSDFCNVVGFMSELHGFPWHLMSLVLGFVSRPLRIFL